MGLVHHGLCFGCGQTNLFGLLLELDRSGPDAASGRCFIKQDHQGPDRGSAHEGVIAAAASDAMALLCGPHARAHALTIELTGAAPVGAFLELAARVVERGQRRIVAECAATVQGRPVARCRGTYRPA